MPTLQQLEQAIEQLLQHPLGVGNYQLVRQIEEKAYEAYVFGLCLQAVRELGITPTLRGISGPPNPFVFRGGPGQIHSTYRNYGYAEFTVNGMPFEIHAGVEFQGTSGMTHELDVCVMRVCSIDKVQDELLRGADDLAHWAKQQFGTSAFAETSTPAIASVYAQMLAWVIAQPHFHESARAEFQQVADGWLAAYGKAKGCIVVTLEEYDPLRRNKVPLVNVCRAFDVKTITPFELLRRLDVKLNWQPSA